MRNKKFWVDVTTRLFDVLLSLFGLLVFLPVILIAMLAIFLEDLKSPIYLASRVGRNGKVFRMMKLRTMVVNAEKIGAMSTAGDDARITITGSVLRRFKIDELVQLWNVLRGEMSLVGPRPNVPNAVASYSSGELELLTISPGITDMASIVFSDEGEILRGSTDPDLDYDRLIRPWKNQLALLYVKNRNLKLYFRIVMITIISLRSRRKALHSLQKLLHDLNAGKKLIKVASRVVPLHEITAASVM